MKPFRPFLCLLALTLATTAQAQQPAVPVAPAASDSSTPALNERQVQSQLNQYLWDAARTSNDAVIREFISAGYNLNTRDEKGYTAVILAAYHGHYDTVSLLLDHGADPCLQDNRGNTALMGAVFKGELKIARLLLAAKCNPDAHNNAGQTAAMYASLFQRAEILKALQEQGADMNATDAMGNSVQALGKGEVKGQ
ncbi:ankyrin repeat domain-containing protein [Dickeya dianthicola]|uniref:ankyrin repeat domain-containing protein n=1 Tax=Dickeya dianthicola TaxID=204039 RepID=UPI00039D6404|nr:ankyrin repeat domain-containing protein [Dickeya dianthicola]MCI4028944.1 ankyrin repeat domain-containing protein [Dickeya dianthicola]MCI4171466.1 ankyrin repeat domain-containing protein [Dickeya dianthicola]MCI4178141.1 ankyrin repeat domain-containing protein [Dickeya dianthicola]MCI4183080.1 ankyrin repeat domain-containing protein [Dickeya dianthicola]MCI4196355.1 ankyrin repeat domain-containing protein [Dickeya dianthicola]